MIIYGTKVRIYYSIYIFCDSKFTKFATIVISVVEGGTGIDAVDADVAPVYFDITGKQIDAPARGLYIKKVGDKITKEFVR